MTAKKKAPSKKVPAAKKSAAKTASTRPTKAEIEAVIKKLVKWRDAYYNNPEGSPVSDVYFDAKEDWVRKWDKDNPYFRKVGAPVRRDRTKVLLPHPMASLSKIKPDGSAAKWLKGTKGPYTASAKADGVSAQHVRDEKTGKEHLYSRGNGTVGQVLDHLLPYLNLGKLKRGEAVRGEIVLPVKDFESKFKKTKKNPNGYPSPLVAVTSLVNAKDFNIKVAKAVKFLAHHQVNPHKPLAQAAAGLRKKGYDVIHHRVIKVKPSEDSLEAILAHTRAAVDHKADGLVLESKDGQRVSFKGADAIISAVVDKVEWNPTKHGLLKPIVRFTEPVLLEGIRIAKATGNNARFVKDHKIGPGAHVQIIRSNGVIPKIIDVLKPGKSGLPEAGTYEWTEKEADIKLLTKAASDTQKTRISARSMESFVKELGIVGLKVKLLERLASAGISSPTALVHADSATLKAAGLGPKQANAVIVQVRDKIVGLDHPKAMAASGVFPHGWGSRVFKALLNEVTFLKLKGMTPSKIETTLTGIKGFGKRRAAQFAEAFPSYVSFLADTGIKPVVLKAGSELRGKTFVFTGLRRPDIEAFIEQRGGKVGSGVTKTTTAVVVADPTTSSVKAKKARDLKVPLWTLPMLIKSIKFQKV